MEITAGPETAMSTGLRQWTMRDIPIAVRLSFDLQKLSLACAGLMAACLAYGAFAWLGDQTGEGKAAQRVFTVLGALLATCICVLFSGMVARMTTVQLLEDRRISAAEMRQFARERWRTLVGIPLSFGGIAITMMLAQGMLTMVGAIPGIGPVVFSASFLVAFSMSLVAVLTALVHMIGAFLYPSIIAMRGGGAVSATLEVVELARRKPLLLMMYEAIVGAVGLLMTLIIGVVVWASVRLTNTTARGTLGERFETMRAAVPDFFRIFLRPLRGVLPLEATVENLPWHFDVSGILLGFSLLVLVVMTLAYPFVFFTSAGSITYLILGHDPTQRERSPIEDL